MGKIRKRKNESPAVSSAKKLVNKYRKSKKLSPKKVANVRRALYEVKEKKKETTASEKINASSQTLPVPLFSVENSVIKGYHEYKTRPPKRDPPHNYRLYVDREYTNIEDVNACLVWLPSLETFPIQYHDIVTDEKKGYKLFDIAGLPVGHVPRGLAESFRQILDSDGVIYAECVGDPLPSFPPWPAPHEKGGGVVIPCHYYVEGRHSNKSQYMKFVKDALLAMPAGEFMRLGIS